MKTEIVRAAKAADARTFTRILLHGLEVVDKCIGRKRRWSASTMPVVRFPLASRLRALSASGHGNFRRASSRSFVGPHPATCR